MVTILQENNVDNFELDIEQQRVEAILDLTREAYEAWVQSCVEQKRAMKEEYMTFENLPTADHSLLFDMAASVFDAMVIMIQTQKVWWV